MNHELNSHSNNEPPNSQKIFMSNGHDLTPRYCLERREYCALRPHSDHKRGITVSIQHCTVVVSSDHNSIPRCTLVISSTITQAALTALPKSKAKPNQSPKDRRNQVSFIIGDLLGIEPVWLLSSRESLATRQPAPYRQGLPNVKQRAADQKIIL